MSLVEVKHWWFHDGVVVQSELDCEACCMKLHSSERDRVPWEIGPVTELEPGTYTLSWSSVTSQVIPVKILRPQSPLSTSHRCAAIQRPLKTCASRLVLNAV